MYLVPCFFFVCINVSSVVFIVKEDLQSWKNGWYTLSDLGEKEIPFLPRNVDPSHVVRSLAGSPNIDLVGAGKDYGKIENLYFAMLHFLFQW